MRNKMISALLAAAVIAAGAVPQAFAFGGTYPKHPEYSGAGGQENSAKGDWEPTDPDYLFTVGGKQFILLDTDDEGNYFVLAEDEYGKHAVDTSYTNRPLVETYSGGQIIPGNADSIVDSEWIYNINDPTNIGYWLNNDFYNNGNGGEYVLPDEIKDNIVEKEWEVEGLQAAVDWTANDKYDDKFGVTSAADFAAKRSLPKYTVGGKLSLMSYTEYKQYQEIIGFGYCDKGWNGFTLRTPHALMTADDNGNLYYAYGGIQVRNLGTAPVEGSTNKMIITVIDAPVTADNFYVRPVMWLDKDFFKNVKVDLTTVGAIPKAEILKNSAADLFNLYSVEELSEFANTLEDTSTVGEISIAGTPVTGSQLYANYSFDAGNGYDEENSEILWLSADSGVSEYKPIDSAGRKLMLGDELLGKSLMCAIATKDAEGNIKGLFTSDASAAVSQAGDTVLISDMDISETSVSVSITNPTEETKTARLIKTIYDENNQLISAEARVSEIEAGGNLNDSMTIEDSEGTIQIMVWTDDNQPLFYLSK